MWNGNLRIGTRNCNHNKCATSLENGGEAWEFSVLSFPSCSEPQAVKMICFSFSFLRKRNKMLMNTSTWTDFENFMWNERSQSERKCYMLYSYRASQPKFSGRPCFKGKVAKGDIWHSPLTFIQMCSHEHILVHMPTGSCACTIYLGNKMSFHIRLWGEIPSIFLERKSRLQFRSLDCNGGSRRKWKGFVLCWFILVIGCVFSFVCSAWTEHNVLRFGDIDLAIKLQIHLQQNNLFLRGRELSLRRHHMLKQLWENTCSADWGTLAPQTGCWWD